MSTRKYLAFDIEITKTNYVPTDSDSNLTFENFDAKYKKVKTIEMQISWICQMSFSS